MAREPSPTQADWKKLYALAEAARINAFKTRQRCQETAARREASRLAMREG